jgi:hypothetical protein
LLPHSLQTSRLDSVTRDVSRPRPKYGSFSSATELRWPQLRQSIAIRIKAHDIADTPRDDAESVVLYFVNPLLADVMAC